MFFDHNGLLDIDEMVSIHPEWGKIMADDIVTDEEVAGQAKRITDLLHEIDGHFTSEQKRR